MAIRVCVVLLAFFIAAAAAAEDNPLLAGIKTDKERYGLRETIKIVYAVENRSKQPVTLSFTSSKMFDVWATRDGKEVWRWSDGKAYTMALTWLTLAPGERRTFDAEWNQKDKRGEQVPPGVYEIWGELTASSSRPAPVSRKAALGKGPLVLSTTVGGVLSRVEALLGRSVSIDAVYQGFKADPDAPACKMGPPVTRADWVIKDKTGCIFVTGRSKLDPVDDLGKPVTVLGVVRRTEKGQPYIELTDVKVGK